jgi:cytochrome b
MTDSDMTSAGGRESAREIVVWDPLVRLIHWSVALAVLLNAAFLDEEGTAHEAVGYVALALVVLRLLWALVGPPHARFSAFPPWPSHVIDHIKAMLRGDRVIHLSHNPLGALMVYNLWVTIIALGVTGYMMTTLRFFGVDWVEELHEAAFAWLMFSVILHVAGVALDTWRTRVNLPLAMFNGRKRVPPESHVE